MFLNVKLLSFLAKGGTLGILGFTVYQITCVPYALGAGVMVVGTVGSAVVAGGHAMATPIVEGSQLLASNINPHYHPRTSMLLCSFCSYYSFEFLLFIFSDYDIPASDCLFTLKLFRCFIFY
jgi:hypothetical protein